MELCIQTRNTYSNLQEERKYNFLGILSSMLPFPIGVLQIPTYQFSASLADKIMKYEPSKFGLIVFFV